MLSRTADSLFWLARYVERAENMARLIDMGRRMSAIPGVAASRRNEWPSILAAAGCADSFVTHSGGPIGDARQDAAIPFLVVERANASSVVCCYEAARGNARSARAALTRDMWEAVNDVWIEFRAMRADRLTNGAMASVIERIKRAAAQFRGAADSSALRDDGYTFLRLGFAIERIDNIARLLDVKSFVVGVGADVASPAAVDRHHWASVLRAAGAELAYHTFYSGDQTSSRVFELLTQNPQCPRSLRHGVREARRLLADLGELYGDRRSCHDAADSLAAMLDGGADAKDALAGPSAHDYLTAVIRRNNALALAIAEDYHFAPKAAGAASEADDAADAAAPSEAAQTAANGGRKAGGGNGGAGPNRRSSEDAVRDGAEPAGQNHRDHDAELARRLEERRRAAAASWTATADGAAV